MNIDRLLLEIGQLEINDCLRVEKRGKWWRVDWPLLPTVTDESLNNALAIILEKVEEQQRRGANDAN